MNQKLFFCLFSFIVGSSVLLGTIGTLISIYEKHHQGTGIIIKKFLKDESDGYVLILVASVKHNKSTIEARILESSYNYDKYKLGEKIDLIYNISSNLEVDALLKPKKYVHFVYYFFIVIGILFLVYALKQIFDLELIKIWFNIWKS